MKRILYILTVLHALSASAQPPLKLIEGEGFRYVGEYPVGQGTRMSEDAGLYIGWSVRTVPQGKGTLYRTDHSRYQGNFVRGVPQGYGRFFGNDGSVIAGEFQGGLANGLDTLYYADGKVFIGICRNGAATKQGRKFKSVDAAGCHGRKPAFQTPAMSEEAEAFLQEKIYGAYDTPALFEGSFFADYIDKHFRVSEDRNGTYAIVSYRIVIGPDGKVTDVVVDDPGGCYGKELTRVLKRSPRWMPAMKDGKPVPYVYRGKIRFCNE